MGRYRLVVPVVLIAVLALGGCGGGSGSGGSADQVKASFAAWVQALQRRNAVGACDVMTPAFWTAFAGDINGRLAGTGRSISTGDCRAGVKSLLALAGREPIVRSSVHAIDVVVHGKTATAREAGAGSSTAPIQFVAQGGRWLIACCVGRQREQQAQTSYRVPSPSMLPTLRVGQVVVSDNAALRAHPPALGAIVVFHPPAGADAASPKCGAPHEGVGSGRVCGAPTAGESAQTFIKRVVGLPGDTIALVNGTVIRNGKAEPRNYKVEPCAQGLACNFPHPVTIPTDEYFVLGDNLPDSDDSRFWGPVKRAWLIGLVRVG
ncbi:MAG TPA: signal peptidase I [Solirubrobacteraceae bacterium]|nr:signal peptidase I [Solirubrobacteraceae bacterium]